MLVPFIGAAGEPKMKRHPSTASAIRAPSHQSDILLCCTDRFDETERKIVLSATSTARAAITAEDVSTMTKCCSRSPLS